MKYIFLLNSTADGVPERGTPEFDQTLADYGAALDTLGKAGVLLDCAPLAASSATTTVRVREGETILTDGPSAEIKEYLGGYTIVDCADLDEALRYAAIMPAAKDASVEVRPIVKV